MKETLYNFSPQMKMCPYKPQTFLAKIQNFQWKYVQRD